MEHVSDKVIERIKKLLALANNNPNEAEASAAMAKANEILEAYNLDMSILGGTDKGKRADTKKTGGLYSWQRRLWESVAKLNFCHYVSLKGLTKGSQYEHRIIGSHANVIATELMAKYLQDAIEKMAQRWSKDVGYKSVFVREAIAFREGMTRTISERLEQRRTEIVTAARKEAEERKRNAARHDVDPGTTALTILDVISSEEDFNNDYLNGYEMGTTARLRAEQEARTAAFYAEWDRKIKERDAAEAANPALKAARLERERRETEKWNAEYKKTYAKQRAYTSTPRERAPTAEERRSQMPSFRDGRAAGQKVGIDTQIDAQNRRAVR